MSATPRKAQIDMHPLHLPLLDVYGQGCHHLTSVTKYFRALKRRFSQAFPSPPETPSAQTLLDTCQVAAAANPELARALLATLLASFSAANASQADFLANALGDDLLVKMIRARSDANDSIMYAQHVFAEIDFLAHKHFQRRPSSVLEIGPGVNLGVLFCFVACGVERAAGADIEGISELHPAFYETLWHYLTCVEGFTWWRYFTEKTFPQVSFPPCTATPNAAELLQRIDYRYPVSSTSLPFEDNSFELVYSVATLEHAPEPAQTIGETRRVLQDGGMNIHEFGLQHHGAADPLRFLEWSDEEYAVKAQPYGDGKSLQGILDGTWQGEVFCNRLRMSDWLDLFHRQGFAILEVEPTVLLDQRAVRPERFVEPFRSKPIDDLAVLGFRIVAQCRK